MSYLFNKLGVLTGGIVGAVLVTFIIYCIAKFIQWIIFEVVYNGKRRVKFRFRITKNLLIMSVVMVFLSYIPIDTNNNVVVGLVRIPMLLILALAVYDQFRNEKR